MPSSEILSIRSFAVLNVFSLTLSSVLFVLAGVSFLLLYHLERKGEESRKHFETRLIHMDPKGFSSNELHILNCGSCRDGIMDKASVSREGAVNVLSVESLGRTSMLPNPPISRNDALLQYSSAKSSKKTLQLKVVKIREFEDFSNIPTIIMALANEKSFLLDPSIKSQLTASSPRDVNQKSDVYSNLSLPSEHSAFGSTRIPNSQKSMKPNSKEPMDTRSKSVFNDILPIPTPTGPPSSAPTPLAETPKTKTMASEVLFAKEGDSPNKPIFSICLAP